MKLITKEIEKKLHSLATVEDQCLEELVAIVRFFHPLYPLSWAVFGGDKTGDDFMFYGMAFNPDCQNGELGYFTLKQLQEIEASFGGIIFKVERDKLFKPIPATKLR